MAVQICARWPRYYNPPDRLTPTRVDPLRELQQQPGQTWPDLRDVKGQHLARRALEIAAAGGHNLLLVGPPGSGKTMLARRLPGILPTMSLQEALEVTQIYSVTGLLPERGGVGESATVSQSAPLGFGGRRW